MEKSLQFASTVSECVKAVEEISWLFKQDPSLRDHPSIRPLLKELISELEK